MIIHGDSLLKLKELEADSVDAVVTDPPYGLKFMGKKWDYDVPSVELWREVFRVLKPGGHVLSFGGTRTYHRMVVAIEDAGFEIRDQVQWIYGSGFPKSHNISKSIDKIEGQPQSTTYKPNFKNYDFGKGMGGGKTDTTTKPNSAEAKQWQGWGTALKPANEPICLARKPLEKGLTVAENVLKYGTGAINVDGTRIEPIESTQGRWPANVLFDEQAAFMLDEQSGVSTSRPDFRDEPSSTGDSGIYGVGYKRKPIILNDQGGASRFFYVAKASKRERNAGLEGMPEKSRFENTEGCRLDEGMVREKFTTAAAANYHPTVKPIKLMEYLIKLITPPNGTILDPFLGSGSTCVAAKKLGFNFIGIELNEEYVEIAQKRIEAA